jgi:hypothetical protein
VCVSGRNKAAWKDQWVVEAAALVVVHSSSAEKTLSLAKFSWVGLTTT